MSAPFDILQTGFLHEIMFELHVSEENLLLKLETMGMH
jgi:hypothetical protein